MPAPAFTSTDRTGNPNDMLTTEETANLLGWTVGYLRVARSAGTINLEPAIRNGKRVYFARGDVIAAADALTDARQRTECEIPGCGRAGRVSRDGLCTGHVTLVRVRGSRDGLSGPPPRLRGLSMAQRFELLTRTNEAGCELWCGPTTNGYGRVQDGGLWRRAHIVAFEQTMGRPVAPGYELDHACENRSCVRIGPGHVVEATHAENIARRSASYWARKAAEQEKLAPVTPLFPAPDATPAEYQQAA